MPSASTSSFQPSVLTCSVLATWWRTSCVSTDTTTQLKSSLTVQGEEDKHYHTQNIVAEQLVGEGFMEILNNSLTKASYYTDFELNAYPDEHTVKVMNPLSADLGVMRQTMLFGGLESVSRNINHKSQNLKFFEVGNTYLYNKEKKLGC